MRMFTPVMCLALLLTALVSSVPTLAEAQDVPVACDDNGRAERFFNLGVRKGRNLAAQAIAGIVGCPDLEEVIELRDTARAIVDALEVPPGASLAVQCHFQGQAAGLVAAILELQAECEGTCIADGQFIGEISALLYCELSIALGGLVEVELFERLATDACGAAFQLACDVTFETEAVDILECVPFTEGTFTGVFLEVKNNQCADNPEDP